VSAFTGSCGSDSEKDLEAGGGRGCEGNILGFIWEGEDFIFYGFCLSLFDIAPIFCLLVFVAVLVGSFWRSAECFYTAYSNRDSVVDSLGLYAYRVLCVGKMKSPIVHNIFFNEY
jgi:hypothetical protein